MAATTTQSCQALVLSPRSANTRSVRGEGADIPQVTSILLQSCVYDLGVMESGAVILPFQMCWGQGEQAPLPTQAVWRQFCVLQYTQTITPKPASTL